MRTGTLADFDLDLHLHSRYSISCSKEMGLESLAEHAPIKGLDGLGTGDCLHGGWLGELEDKLDESGGRYTFGGTSFILQSEVETLEGGRVHHLLLFPDFQAVHDMREYLHRREARQIDRTGRPQVRISGGELLLASLDIGALCGPAHAFTPYVGMYAHHCSVTGCYGRTPPFLELGLSADTGLAIRIDELSGVSFSPQAMPTPRRPTG